MILKPSRQRVYVLIHEPFNSHTPLSTWQAAILPRFKKIEVVWHAVAIGAWPGEAPHTPLNESALEQGTSGAMYMVGRHPAIAHVYAVEAEAMKIKSSPTEIVRLVCVS